MAHDRISHKEQRQARSATVFSSDLIVFWIDPLGTDIGLGPGTGLSPDLGPGVGPGLIPDIGPGLVPGLCSV